MQYFFLITLAENKFAKLFWFTYIPNVVASVYTVHSTYVNLLKNCPLVIAGVMIG